MHQYSYFPVQLDKRLFPFLTLYRGKTAIIKELTRHMINKIK